MTGRFNLVVNYTLSKAKTWGCVLGELFDYVDGVCDPLHAFGPGDFGPSGEDVTHRLVVAGIFHTPGGFELSLLSQAESARPITLTTPVDVNGFGDTLDDRAVINGVQSTLDQFRGTPYIQVDVRVARPFKFQERWSVMPFIEFFNLFNRNNPGANYSRNHAVIQSTTGCGVGRRCYRDSGGWQENRTTGDDSDWIRRHGAGVPGLARERTSVDRYRAGDGLYRSRDAV